MPHVSNAHLLATCSNIATLSYISDALFTNALRCHHCHMYFIAICPYLPVSTSSLIPTCLILPHTKLLAHPPLYPLPHVATCHNYQCLPLQSASIATCLILPHAIFTCAYLCTHCHKSYIATRPFCQCTPLPYCQMFHIAIRPLSLLPYVLFILVNSEIYSLYHVDCRIFKYMVTTINHTSDTLVNIG